MNFAPFFNLRNRLLGSAKFRRIAEKLPFGQWFARRHADRLFRLSSGFIHSQVLLACVRLSLFERLRRRALTVADIATMTGLDERGLRPLLSAAAALRLLERRRGDRFGLGPLGAAMHDNPAVTSLVRHHDVLYQDLADPVALFAGGDTALSRLWSYADNDSPGDLDATQVAAYTELMSESQTMVAEQVLSAYRFRDVSSVVDIGGGSAAFAMALARRYPSLSITVADLPAVADIARDRVKEAGLERRIDVVGVDATRGDIPGSYALATLVRILHDHDDDAALKILASARRSLVDGGTLLVAEPLAGKDAAGSLNEAYFSVYLLAMGSGRPRRFEELEALLEAAGFHAVRRHRTRVPLITSVISARR